MPVSAETPRAKVEHAIIDPDLVEPRCAFGNIDISRSVSQMLRRSPAIPPIAESRMLSVSICRRHARAARAHRGPDRNFLLPRGAAGEEEIGHVRAGNEQHESDGAEKREEGWLHLPNEPFVERRKRGVPAFVRLVKLLGELRVDRADASLRLLQIDAGIQTRDRRPRAIIARFFREIDRARHPNLGLLREFKPRRHHADDREGP